MRYKAVLEPWPACPVSPQRQVRLSSHRKMLGQRQGLLRARRADQVCVTRRESLGGSLWRDQRWPGKARVKLASVKQKPRT